MNLLSVLRSRELGVLRGRYAIQQLLEDSFLTGKSTKVDFNLPSSVSSTIAIGLSCDGKTVATTHGDHTVKVFIFISGLLLRVFTGHPRTPWTVKYHPTDSDILASGCLGFEVRVWNIKSNSCVNFVKLELSIISLAFHPCGDYLAIANGSSVNVWNWVKERNGITSNSSSSSGNRMQRFEARSIDHMRNIRAVVFHPGGNYLFIAAPDSPKLANEAQTHCRLYAVRFFTLLDSNSLGDPLQLSAQSVLIPQIHLYSDGGLDMSHDGHYLLTCVQLDCYKTKLNIYGTTPLLKGNDYIHLASDNDASAKVSRLYNGNDLNPLDRWSLCWSPGGYLYKFADVKPLGTIATENWNADDHVCLIQLNFDTSGVMQLPLILNSSRLPGTLPRAVTSTKISPTCRYALIGFGVRVNNSVVDHPVNPQTACEILSLKKLSLKREAIMCDMEDEVNIAQFHPIPGHGIVYGTKRGKVRCFTKS